MVIELLKDVNRPQESLQSQIGKLLNIFQNGFYQTEDDFRKYLNEYLEHIRRKRERPYGINCMTLLLQTLWTSSDQKD